MQIKTTTRYHFTLVRMAIMKKSTDDKCWRGYGENGPLLHCWWDCKLVQPLWRLELPQKIKNRITIWSNNPNPGHISSQVHFSCSVVSDSLWPHEPQHARPPCPSPTPGIHPNPRPLSWWCCPTVSSSFVPYFSCPQSFPASGSFPMSQLFTSSGQSIGVSASASVLPMNIQDWFPLGWTDWISLPSKGLSRVFSNTRVQKHQFFSAQLSLWSNSHIHTWPLEKL